MKFTEEYLESAVIELLQAEKYEHKNGMYIHREITDVLLRDNLSYFYVADIQMRE